MEVRKACVAFISQHQHKFESVSNACVRRFCMCSWDVWWAGVSGLAINIPT